MRLIIEIPEKVVTAIQNGEDYRYDIHTAIAQGIPYEDRPQGDLISREALKAELPNEWNYDDDRAIFKQFETLIDNAPTVKSEKAKEGELVKAYTKGFDNGVEIAKTERPQVDWGKWVISEIRCPKCLEYFQTDCYSTEELKKCPNCETDMKGGAE